MGLSTAVLVQLPITTRKVDACELRQAVYRKRIDEGGCKADELELVTAN